MRRFPAIVLLIPVLAACSGAAAPENLPAQLEKLDGDEQQALIFDTLPDPLRVRVLDTAGRPMPGVNVGWIATRGTIAPALAVTDTDGIAAAEWWFIEPNTSYAHVGTHQATATAAGLTPVTFTGYARLGRNLVNVWIDPNVVDVGSADGVVSIRAHATDDWGELTTVAVQLVSPSRAERIDFTHLHLVEGDGKDGIWENDIVIPQGSETGVWVIAAVRYASGCAWTLSPEGVLASMGMQYQITVTADNGGGAAPAAVRAARADGDSQPLTGVDTAACVVAAPAH
jgi:hypothetical protein